ncbi:hypothetical protein GCM10010842_38610 [Deinococcus daejeonensis]|uniref:VWFA domain-containing protein n=1 Tax=Deinococcus daejeonensis TaxID=1007098 RepID=A0ABQ2JJM9_9DEIO|nr:hypothetical protein GCM10010842_38610 [Deinococcus daejeonensis]
MNTRYLLPPLLLLSSAQGSSPTVNAALLNEQAERLYREIETAVTAAGGDLEAQHVHLAVAFSTGHFARDPRMAEAARVIASDLAQQHLVDGDQLSSYAWEQRLWPHAGESLNPLKITRDRAALRANFQNLWPRTAQAGSEGGHDTEAVITELAQRFEGKKDTVLVLLTNTAASSAGRAGERTIGENAPDYVSALTRWTRVRTNTTGATLSLPFGEGNRTLDAVILTPRTFSGAALSRPRTELLTQQTDAPTPQPARRVPWLPILLGVAALAGLILARRGQGARTRPSRRDPLTLHVAGRAFPLKDSKDGDVICTVVGPGYPIPPSNAQYVTLGAGLPAIKFLTVTRAGSGLKVTPDLDVTVEGDAPAPIPADRDAEYTLNVKGRAPSKPNLPPRPYQTTLTLALRPEEQP